MNAAVLGNIGVADSPLFISNSDNIITRIRLFAENATSKGMPGALFMDQGLDIV